MRKDVDTFIKDHTHINYCEAIIYKDGTIEYVKPSHVETLLRITGEDREAIYNKMPIWDIPIVWLTEYTSCISIWSNGFIKPKTCTKKQELALDKLMKAELVATKPFK